MRSAVLRGVKRWRSASPCASRSRPGFAAVPPASLRDSRTAGATTSRPRETLDSPPMVSGSRRSPHHTVAGSAHTQGTRQRRGLEIPQVVTQTSPKAQPFGDPESALRRLTVCNAGAQPGRGAPKIVALWPLSFVVHRSTSAPRLVVEAFVTTLAVIAVFWLTWATLLNVIFGHG
jgi:hypothetical protein